VEARDLGKPVQRMGRSRVLLYIGDVNDNRPVISVTYIAPSVDNTGTLFTLVIAFLIKCQLQVAFRWLVVMVILKKLQN